MGRFSFLVPTALGMALFPAAGLGRAQAPSQRPIIMQRPTVSPYLNLARGGPPGLNYYNLVRPQTQLYNSVQQLQQQVGTNRQEISGVQQSLQALPTTGHPVRFMTHGSYFMTLGQSATPFRTVQTAVPGGIPPRPAGGPQGTTPAPPPRSR